MPLPVRPLLALALVLVAGCDSSEPDTARSQIEADLSLELGETASSDGLAITFDAVLEDSRCPADVVCVWAGFASVRLVVDGVADSLGVADPEAAPEAFIRRGDVLVRAVDVTPYPGTAEDRREATPVVYLRTERAAE